MSDKENWKKFMGRVQRRLSEYTESRVCFANLPLEILSDGDCLPGPIVARRGNVYVCENTPEPQCEEDFTVCVIV